jgi:cytochrome c oxidase subunit I+III
MRTATRAIRANRPPLAALAAALAAGLVLAVCCGAMLWRTPSPGEHAYGATLFVLGSYGLFHALLALLMVAFLIARVLWGHTSAARRAEFPIVGVWVDYTAAIVALSLVVGHLSGMGA